MKLSDQLRVGAALLDKWEELNQSKYIKIWKREHCPKEIMDCFENHDDIDQIAFIPNELRDEYFPFLEQPAFGCCDVERHETVNGIIVVGYHA